MAVMLQATLGPTCALCALAQSWRLCGAAPPRSCWTLAWSRGSLWARTCSRRPLGVMPLKPGSGSSSNGEPTADRAFV